MQLREWQIQGLPSDGVSLENSLFVRHGYRWPLLIDPQMQATKWLKNSEPNLRLIKFTHSNFIRVLQLAIPNGEAVLVEDVDETLDPAVDTILAKAFYESEGRLLLRFADSDVLYDKNFRIYLATNKPNPNYLPEIFIQVRNLRLIIC
jgi:dynein heavy chain